jgi:hypothetical protein
LAGLTDDGEYCNGTKAYRGHDEVTTAVTVSHDHLSTASEAVLG